MDSSLSLGRLELNSSPTLGVNLSPRPSSGPPVEETGLPQGPSHLSGCVPLSHQVAGHKYGVDKVGILQHPDGTVLKQLQPPPRGPREMQFYTKVYAKDCYDPCMLELQNHLPKYYGTCCSLDSPNDLYLKLEDVTRRFTKPCIMDVKLGQQSYDPFASQEKREMQIWKYPLMEDIGFLLLGMRVYKVCDDSFETYDQHYGRGLVKDTVKEGLSKFFHNGAGLRLDAVTASVRRVRRILAWFQSQRQLVFYASSLLFVYEGHPSPSSPPSSPPTLSPVAAPGTEVAAEDRDVRDTGVSTGGGRDEGRSDSGVLKEMSEYNNNNIQGWTTGFSLAHQYDNQRKAAQHYRHAGKAHRRGNHGGGGGGGGVPMAAAPPAAPPAATDPAGGDIQLQPNGNGVVLMQADAERRAASDGGETEGGGGGGGGRRDTGPTEGKGGEVEVRMIDFAHVFPSDSQDHGYIYGLKHLLAVLEEIHDDAS
ncbi:inositol polyphosphate multikinase [Gadus macrocephalus]|uniref:inositol polyphosphate multikinase n=1 Tax=Gadus macrocephalus TaxID=80720 RepID=UPI0028CB87B9|nr:inositol polyphosphate multikinase [Gadus macrocephalus]